jgi:hypothetical protein
MKTKIHSKLGIYAFSLITLCGPFAHAAPCHWEHPGAAEAERNQLAAAEGDRNRIAIQTQAKAQNDIDVNTAENNQSVADKNSKNMQNLISRLQMAVAGLNHLAEDFSADEGGRAALALAVTNLPGAGGSITWIGALKAQLDDIALTDSLRVTTTGILNAFSEASPDPRIRLQDANLALRRAFSANDLDGAKTGIDIATDTVNARLQDATAISQTAKETLMAANQTVADALKKRGYLNDVLGWLNKDLNDEMAAARAASAQKGDWECNFPLPIHAPN